MAEWIYFLHAPREDFAATMTEREATAFTAHFAYLQGLEQDGVLILAGPTLGTVNTGIAIFEARDRDTAQAVMDADPAIAAGVVRGELREMRVSLLRGRS